MTKALSRILIFVSFCLDLYAESSVDFKISAANNGQRILKAEIKNPDVKPVVCEMRLFIKSNDISENWQKVKTSDGSDYVLKLGVTGDGRASLSLDLLKLLIPHDAQQLKVEYTVMFRDKNGIVQTTDTVSREYSLNNLVSDK